MSFIVKINSLQAFAMLVLVAVPCRAHEGGHGESEHIQQTWQFSNGSTIEGSFVSTTGTHLRLLTAQGVVIQVAVEQLNDRSRQAMERQKRRADYLNRSPAVKLVAQVGSDQVGPASTADRSAPRPAIADSFKAFEKTVMLRWDRSFLFVESNGLPDHSMMGAFAPGNNRCRFHSRIKVITLGALPCGRFQPRNPSARMVAFSAARSHGREWCTDLQPAQQPWR